jgi:hypothetical protein
MLPRLSQRTYDIMRRTLDAVDKDTGDLVTTLVASAFVDGNKEAEAQESYALGIDSPVANRSLGTRRQINSNLSALPVPQP